MVFPSAILPNLSEAPERYSIDSIIEVFTRPAMARQGRYSEYFLLYCSHGCEPFSWLRTFLTIPEIIYFSIISYMHMDFKYQMRVFHKKSAFNAKTLGRLCVNSITD